MWRQWPAGTREIGCFGDRSASLSYHESTIWASAISHYDHTVSVFAVFSFRGSSSPQDVCLGFGYQETDSSRGLHTEALTS